MDMLDHDHDLNMLSTTGSDTTSPNSRVVDTLVQQEECTVIKCVNALSDTILLHHNTLYQELVRDCKWDHNVSYRSYGGKMVTTPRGMFVLGDNGVKSYRYNSVTLPCVSWDVYNTDNTPNIIPMCYHYVRHIRDEVLRLITELTGHNIYFNSCLMNYYRDGSDNVAYHPDKEALGYHNAVATVSLGTSRRFLIRHNDTRQVIETRLEPCDVLMMLGETQRKYEHSIPKTSTNVVSTGRVSLTYRLVQREER